MRLTEEQMRAFREDGVLVAEGMVTDDDLAPMIFTFMHRCTPHRSTPNSSDGVRWSLDLRYQPTGTPTGRPFHPAFIARSRAHPESVLTDHVQWSRRWVEALAQARNIQAHRV